MSISNGSANLSCLEPEPCPCAEATDFQLAQDWQLSQLTEIFYQTFQQCTDDQLFKTDLIKPTRAVISGMRRTIFSPSGPQRVCFVCTTSYLQ